MTPLTPRPVDPDGDAALLRSWVTEDRARFWGMTERTLEEVAETYGYIDEQDHLAAYLVEHDGSPIALFQTYDPFVDDIGDHYDRAPGDLGVHLFMAAKKPVRTDRVTRFILGTLFGDPAVRRVVAEPDARNSRAVALVQRVGFELGPQVQLPHKPAQFAFLRRSAFEGNDPE